MAGAVSMVATSGVLVWLALSINAALVEGPGAPRGEKATPPSVGPVSLVGTAIHGDLQAKVGVIEFTDFECPFCRRFALDTLPEVIDRYVAVGKAFIAFRHFPLEAIHKDSAWAAAVAECGRQQGHFWPFHQALFSAERVRSVDVAQVAEGLGLDVGAFHACSADDGLTVARSQADEAKQLGIRGTPTFLFGLVTPDGTFRVIAQESGAISFSTFAKQLDATIALAAQEPVVGRPIW